MTQRDKLGRFVKGYNLWNKQNNNPNNLISLCRNCHAQTNWNREDWISYFQNKRGDN